MNSPFNKMERVEDSKTLISPKNLYIVQCKIAQNIDRELNKYTCIMLENKFC